MVLIILFFCYFGQAYSCARTADVSTTTLPPGVTTTLAPGVTTTTIAGQTTTTIAGQTTTSSTTTSTAATTTTTNQAQSCMETDIGLQPQPNVPGSAPTAGPITVMNNANVITITCTAATTAATQISLNNGQFILAPAAMAEITFTCNSAGQWTFPDPNGVPQVIMTASCNDA